MMMMNSYTKQKINPKSTKTSTTYKVQALLIKVLQSVVVEKGRALNYSTRHLERTVPPSFRLLERRCCHVSRRSLQTLALTLRWSSVTIHILDRSSTRDI